jgi:hypothetical protein
MKQLNLPDLLEVIHCQRLLDAPEDAGAYLKVVLADCHRNDYDQSDAAKMLQMWRMIFMRARQVGLETAFDEKAELDHLVYRIEQMTARNQMRQRVELCRRALA